MCRATQLCLQRHSPGRAPAREGFLLSRRGVISELFGGLCPQEYKIDRLQRLGSGVPPLGSRVPLDCAVSCDRKASLIRLGKQGARHAWHLHLSPLVHQCPGVSCTTLPPGEESADPNGPKSSFRTGVRLQESVGRNLRGTQPLNLISFCLCFCLELCVPVLCCRNAL